MYIAGVVVLLLCILFAAITYRWHYYPFQWERFNREKWLSYDHMGNNDNLCVRGPMVYSLRHFHLKRGMTKDATVEMLGQTFHTKKQCIEYILGMCSGIRIDYDVLGVCFDEKNSLTHSYRAQG